MIFGLKTVLLVLCAVCVSDAVRSTLSNASTRPTTTKRPFRPRLRWPGSRVRHSTTTTTTTTEKPTTADISTPTVVARLENSIVTELVSEVTTSTKDFSLYETTLDLFSGSTLSPQTTVSNESTIPLNQSNNNTSPHQEKASTEDGNTTELTMKTTSDGWNSSDESQTVPSIFVETLFNFSFPEKVLRFEEEVAAVDVPQRVPDSKTPKSSLNKNTVITRSTTSSYVPLVPYRHHHPLNDEPVEYKGVYTSETTESPPQETTSTAVNTTNDVQSGGTYIYVVAVVGVIPTVGMLMCFAKHVFSRPEKSKEASKTTSYCTVDFPISEPRRETTVREADQSNKLLQNNTFQSVYPSAQYGCSNVKTSWKRMHLEYPRENLELTEVLGEGNFGIVWKAEAIDIEEPRHHQIVAVKTVKETASYKERHELLRELRIMQLFDDHPNVVRLLGCCTDTEPYFLIMEFVKNGKLQSFLRDHRSKRKYYNSTPDGLSSRDLTTFAYQIANGMEYISRIGVIHRDLAARNILVDHNNVCKVADFGLSRTTEDGDNGLYEQKTKGALPIRWMAPESLYLSIFTAKSDVWAFGILLWEIVTLGSTPYPGMGAREVMHHVQKGNIMECPDHCHPDLYSVMCACWKADPNGRPTFKDLRETLGSHLEIQAGYVDLDHFPESSFYNLYQSPGEKV